MTGPATAGRQVVYADEARPGNRHDIVVARATAELPEGITTLTDGGHQPLPGATVPKDDPLRLAARKGQRTRIEHALARMKDWQMLR